MSKHAVILVGGKGTRLRPYTLVIPKPLMPIGEIPILEIILNQLASSGFTSVTLATNHQSEIVAAFCGDGSKWDLRINYSKEDQPLSTMGPLNLIKDLPENFIVMNGDVLTDLNFGSFLDKHTRSDNRFTIAAVQRELKSDYGVLESDLESNLISFNEKPVSHILVSMGVYAVNRKTLEYIPRDTPFGFDDLMYKLIAEKQFPKIHTHKGRWHDIGQPDDCAKAIEDYQATPEAFLKR